MNETPHNSNPTDEPQSEQRLGQVTGDRICHKCTFILTGQTIVREPRYDLLIVRCPECGAVTPMHEYPSLSRWSRRLAAAAAGLLMLFIFALWMGNAGAFCGISIGAAESSSWQMTDIINQMYMEDTGGVDQNTNQLIFTSGSGIAPGSVEFRQWLDQQSIAGLISRAGGLNVLLDVPMLFGFTTLASGLAVLFGILWSIILIRRGWLVLLIWTLVITGTALFFSSFVLIEWLSSRPANSWQAPRHFFGPTLLLSTLSLQTIVLYIAMFIGRPIARAMVRLLVPPKLWPSLHWLWTARGLEPPAYRR